MDAVKPRSAGALYYPYIHIQDLNWLRANLLIFQCVERMVPEAFTPRDSPAIFEFTASKGGEEPLLRPADLWTARSLEAQRILASKLRRDAEDDSFVLRYGEDAARRLVEWDDLGFQIHAGKLSAELRDVLCAGDKLAWKPLNREVYDFNSQYVEVHPRVGEAVMSTLAIACAQGEGLDIVGDARSGSLYRCLLEKDLNGVYDWWLGRGAGLEEPRAASGEELMEFILGIPGDLSALTADRLREIAGEREAIDKLIGALREQAAKIPAMDDGKKREDAFKEAASKVMDEWEKDKANLSGFARAFFGADSSKLATDFASKVADKTLTGLVTGATATKVTATAAASAGWLGSLATGGVIGAGAGLVIGLVAHAGKSYLAQRKREKDSPYRFLTTLEEAGVVFRSEAQDLKGK